MLVDDLITMGTTEPYRMFTSRAEYRLMLREDNADLRLTEQAHQLGLIDEQRWRLFNEKRDAVVAETGRLENLWVGSNALPQEEVERKLECPVKKDQNLLQLLKRPEFSYAHIARLLEDGQTVDARVAEQVEIQAKYSGYIQRQEEEIARNRKHEETALPDDIDYTQVRGLSTEVVEKLSRHRPVNLGQATRIQGITPAAISLLRVYLKKQSLLLQQSA